jgi:hypothetical protein
VAKSSDTAASAINTQIQNWGNVIQTAVGGISNAISGLKLVCNCTCNSNLPSTTIPETPNDT